MLLGLAENLLYNLQASTYRWKENHLKQRMYHITLLKEEEMLSHYILLCLEARWRKMNYLDCFLKAYAKYNQTSALVQFRKKINTRHHFHFSDWQKWKTQVVIVINWGLWEYKWGGKLTMSPKNVSKNILGPRNSTSRDTQLYLLHLIIIIIYFYISASFPVICFVAMLFHINSVWLIFHCLVYFEALYRNCFS